MSSKKRKHMPKRTNGLDIELSGRGKPYGVCNEEYVVESGARTSKTKTAWQKVKEQWSRASTGLSLKQFAKEHGITK
jgi:hypothetical protein